MRKKRSRRRGSGADSSARARAKELLREGGQRIEGGDRAGGLASMTEALAADPTFVEPALVLARLRDEDGEAAVADALVEEAVRRGAGTIESIPRRRQEEPRWWRDEATRPYMKALVARGWRRLARAEPLAAAEQFKKVFELEPDEDPLLAGVYAAESYVHAGQYMAALQMYSQLIESPDVCYGRAVALLATEQRQDALVSMWLGALLNGFVAEGLLGVEAFAGVARADVVGDAGEAEELLGRIEDCWSADARQLLRHLIADPQFTAQLRQWAQLARALDVAVGPQAERTALAEIERFLQVGRIESAVQQFLDRLGPTAPRRLPSVQDR